MLHMNDEIWAKLLVEFSLIIYLAYLFGITAVSEEKKQTQT